jgi:hypothetical protein
MNYARERVVRERGWGEPVTGSVGDAYVQVT